MPDTISKEDFIEKWHNNFADNLFQNIDEAMLREYTDDITRLQGGGGVFPDDAPPTAQAWLNLPAGSIIAGRSLVEVAMQALSRPENFPSYDQPYVTLDGLQSADVERGTTLQSTLTPVFHPGNAGALLAYLMKFNNTGLASDNVAPIDYAPFSDIYQIGEETVTYTALFSYAQGPLKYGDQGNPAPGRIEAGTRQAVVSFRGLARAFWGTRGSSPASSADVRSLVHNQLLSGNSVTISLETGSTDTHLVVSVPAGWVLQSAIDMGNQQANVKPFYQLNAALQVADAGGTARAHNTYEYTLGIPYNPATTHVLTFTRP